MPDDFRAQYHEILQASVRENLPAAILDHFEVASCLAFDDAKELYLLRDKQNGKKSILRVTKGETIGDATIEAGILSELDHPAIAKVIRQWSENGRSFLLREYFEGMTLRAHVKTQGVCTAAQILDIAIELCDVLTYIHSQAPPVIHRDIKPDNIILSQRNGLKLIDFGIARKFLPGTTKDTQIIGTEPYMAPEQYGSEQTDGRSDLYSLGVTMIFMATGQDGKQFLNEEFPYRALVPIIEKCIKLDRRQRFQSAERLKRRLLWIKRRTVRKILFGAGACVLVISALGIGVALGTRRGFDQGVQWLMDVPSETVPRYTVEDGYEQITFDSWELEMAVRGILNKDQEAPIYVTEVRGQVDKLRIYGTYITHPSLNTALTKTHREKDWVEYWTSDGFQITERGDVSSLLDVQKAYYLRELTLTSQSIADLSPLTGMKLTKIDLSNNFVGNLMPIKDMATLKELALCQNPLNNLMPISRLLSLEALDISQTQVSDLRPIAELTKLKHLELNYSNVKDLSPLQNLARLQTLGMRGISPNAYDSLKIDSLLSLDVSDSGLQDTAKLPGLPALETLVLSDNPIASVEDLKRYETLTSLRLDGTDIMDIDGLEALPRLQQLDLSGTDVRDISAIAQMPALRELILSNTNVTDLTPLMGREEMITLIYPGIPAEIEAQVRDEMNILLIQQR